MEKIIPIDNQEIMPTQTIQAAYLENGDKIFIGDIEFEVTDIDNQHKDGYILIKNKAGEINRFLADNFVEKVVVKDEGELIEEAA